METKKENSEIYVKNDETQESSENLRSEVFNWHQTIGQKPKES